MFSVKHSATQLTLCRWVGLGPLNSRCAGIKQKDIVVKMTLTLDGILEISDIGIQNSRVEEKAQEVTEVHAAMVIDEDMTGYEDYQVR